MFNFKKYIFIPLLVIILAVVTFFTGCKKNDNQFIHLTGEAQGTTFSIKYGSINLIDYSREIDSIFNVINLSMSTYHPNSIISKINNGNESIELDSHFINVFNISSEIFHETDGAFDPTVGILVNAYGFGPNKLDQLETSDLTKLMQWVGFNKIHIENQKLVKDFSETSIDFNAIAQGYTVDVIGDFLISKNIANFMIEVGGEVIAHGKNSEGKPWSIGIQNPEKSNENSLEMVVYLENKSICTSGNYRKFKIDKNGRKYAHTINPKTGLAEPSDILSATVITAKPCAFADAYATSMMVMGFTKTLEFMKSHPELEIFLVFVDEKGNTQTYSTIKN